jgi:hypothetical protein
MAALPTTTKSTSRAAKQAEDISSVTATTAAVTHAPTSVLRDGLMSRITRGLLALYDSLTGPAMSQRERINHELNDYIYKGKFRGDVFWA